MTDTVAPAPEPETAEPGGSRLVRGLGWTLVSAGVLVLLYLVYVLWFTGFETSQAQDDLEQALLDEWSLQVEDAEVEAVLPGDGEPGAEDAEAEAVAPGDAVAAIRFERPGSDAPLVRDGPLYVVEGVDEATLRRGPGRYPDTSLPGGAGNFAISGHRTTYGAPFFDLDDVAPGDLIHVTDRANVEHTYEVVEQRIVSPFDVWVVGPDPLGNGRPLMTLTTCHPRWSNAQRLIVFAELVT